MYQPLEPTDRFVDNLPYADHPCTVYEREDGTVYRISSSRYTGVKTVTEFANRQAWNAYHFDKAFDPEGKGHKGATSDGGSLRRQAARRDSLFTRR
jgi:hypothetical protein